jgi:ubiquinone/menaquinone biosynthesis C-methylase UbiE
VDDRVIVPPPKPWAGLHTELRHTGRRQTLAVTSLSDVPGAAREALITNISIDGAYLRTADPIALDRRLEIALTLPTGWGRPIRLIGRVVRADAGGFGVRFEEIQSRDRSKLREYAAFAEMDAAFVELQRGLAGWAPGNLLPISDPRLTAERLRAAAERGLPVTVLRSLKDGRRLSSRLAYGPADLWLEDLEEKLPPEQRVVYCVVADGALHTAFEGLIVEHGDRLRLLMPERLYHNERRGTRREKIDDARLAIAAPHLAEGEIRLPVVDISESGCAVIVPRAGIVAPGMRLPPFRLHRGATVLDRDGATVVRVTLHDPKSLVLGLSYLDRAADRDAFEQIRSRSLRSNVWSSVVRLGAAARQKLSGLVSGKSAAVREPLFVVRYKNTRGDMVVALVDATFDLYDDPPPVDVAVLIGPPFPIRKEVFGLLARTLVDNFRHQGLNAVVLRFDLTHCLGESEADPDMVANGCPFLRWTYSHLESDMIASLAYLERRFRPAKRVLTTYSVAAIPARRMIADGEKPGVDLWIAPFGCPDGQDMHKNYLAGVDLFPVYLRGEKAEPFLIYGRLADPSFVMPDAIRRGMAFLEDARNDMTKIKIPVVWFVGTYDYMVTRERVRQMLNAPGEGVREIFETATGHNPKAGPEAIESFKLIYESIAKHLFGLAQPAIEPDLAVFARQNEAEWARTKRKTFSNAAEFWNRHMFGTSDEKEGYDVLLYNPTYVDFLNQQVKLLDVAPGHRVADIGCGTGNLSVALLHDLDLQGQPLDLTCLDLLPKAVDCAQKKIAQLVDDPGGAWRRVDLHCRAIDLEAARLRPWRDFLEGKLHGPTALIGRLEGVAAPTIRKWAENYGDELHRILRGEPATVERVRQLLPALDDVEAEMTLDLSRISRFLNDELLPDDLVANPGDAIQPRVPQDSAIQPRVPQGSLTAADLRLRQLNFGRANRACRFDLPSGSFDRIGGSLILPYLYDSQTVLDELYRLLAPGGVIVLSSLKPNFDQSKSYIEEAETIAKRTDLGDVERERLLASLREFGAFVGNVMELEEEGRFRFFSTDEFVQAIRAAGFVEARTCEGFGDPPTAAIVRAVKDG